MPILVLKITSYGIRGLPRVCINRTYIEFVGVENLVRNIEGARTDAADVDDVVSNTAAEQKEISRRRTVLIIIIIIMVILTFTAT